MADCRRYLYALAVVALLAGLSVPASAQSFQCSNTTSVIPNVRGEGYAELLGDIVLDCTGGTPTPAGQTIPGVNIVVQLDTTVSSRVTATQNTVQFLEALLIVDEPNSTVNPTVPRVIRNCGAANEDSTSAGAGVCPMQGVGAAAAQTTYDGTCVTIATCHPNVFQGRSLGLVTGQWNQVLFAQVPIDPPGTQCAAAAAVPGTPCHRIIRITNIRGDATAYNVGIGGLSAPVTANLIINPVSGLPVDIFSHVIARVQAGLLTPVVTTNSYTRPDLTKPSGKFDFIQCNDLVIQSQGPAFGDTNTDPTLAQALALTFREGFFDSFKPRNLRQVLDNGVAVPAYNYTGGPGGIASPVITNVIGNLSALYNQNTPGTTYSTESGFMNAFGTASGTSPGNPLAGPPVTAGSGNVFVDTTTGGGTGIVGAGRATQGTRLIATFAAVPTGTDVIVPNVAFLYNVIDPTKITGVAVLVAGADAAGAGGTGLSSVTATAAAGVFGNTIPTSIVAGSLVPGQTLAPSGRAVYEVLFSNPGALEQLVVPMKVVDTCTLGTLTTPCPNLPSNLPQPNQTATVTGGFAPFYAPSASLPGVRTVVPEPVAGGPSPAFPVPRFINLNAPLPLFSIVRCSCNLLFPFVTNAATAGGSYDTGMAIANTSLDPGNLTPNTYGFRATPQSGPIQLWYYNRNGATAAEPNFLGQGNTQCTNATNPGKCGDPTTATSVPPGGMLTMTLNVGGYIMPSATNAGPQVLLPTTPQLPFQGYLIAQAGFQYCHGFAFISKQGAGFQADNMAMGYLAIVLDQGGLKRTFSLGENDAH